MSSRPVLKDHMDKAWTILARPDADPDQWALIRAHIENQPDADYLADVMGLDLDEPTHTTACDHRRATFHPRTGPVQGGRA